MRTEGLTILAALGLHVAVLLVGRAMTRPTFTPTGPSQELVVIDIEVPKAAPPPTEPPPVRETEPQPPGAAARVVPRDTPRSPVHVPPPEGRERPEPSPQTQVEPQKEGRAPTKFDDPSDEQRGVLGVPGVPGLNGAPLWAITGVIPSAGAAAPAPTEAPKPRPVDRDIGGKVVREAMNERDKKIGLDLPAAGTVASVVADVVRGSDVPNVARGAIEFRISATGQVLGYRVLASSGGSSDVWDRAARAAAARLSGQGLAMTGAFAKGATITVDISSNVELPSGSGGKISGTGLTFDISNLGAHTSRIVRTSFRVAAAR